MTRLPNGVGVLLVVAIVIFTAGCGSIVNELEGVGGPGDNDTDTDTDGEADDSSTEDENTSDDSSETDDNETENGDADESDPSDSDDDETETDESEQGDETDTDETDQSGDSNTNSNGSDGQGDQDGDTNQDDGGDDETDDTESADDQDDTDDADDTDTAVTDDESETVDAADDNTDDDSDGHNGEQDDDADASDDDSTDDSDSDQNGDGPHQDDTDRDDDSDAGEDEPPLTVVATDPETGEPIPDATVIVGWERTSADANGVATFDLEPGTYDAIVVDGEPVYVEPHTEVTVEDEPTTVEVEAFQIPPEQCTATVKVIDAETGEPIERAPVIGESWAENFNEPLYLEGETDADGTATVEGFCGEWHVTVDGVEGYEPGLVDQEIEGGETVTVELEPQFAGEVDVTIVATNQDGDRLEGATIEGEGDTGSETETIRGETDSDGEYTTTVRAGDYEISVSHPAYETGTERVRLSEGTTTVAIELESEEGKNEIGEPANNRFRIEVISSRSGLPIEGATVQLSGEPLEGHETEYSGETDDNGVFATYINSNSYEFVIDHPDYERDTFELPITAHSSMTYQLTPTDDEADILNNDNQSESVAGFGLRNPLR